MTASIGFATDYVDRGYTKSRGNPVMRGNLDYAHASGFYAGGWAVPVNFDDNAHDDRAHVEVSPYLGWAGRLAEPWGLDLCTAGYLYDGDVFGRNGDYSELSAAVSYRDRVTARFGFTPDAYGRDANTYDYALTARYSLLDRLQLSGGVGFNQTAELLYYDYFYWNLGFTWYPTRFLAADFRYVDSDLKATPDARRRYFHLEPLDRPFLFSITLGF